MIRKIDSNIFSLTILKVTTFSRIRQCLFLIIYIFSLTIRELLLSKDGLSQVVAHHLEILSAKLTKSIGNKEFAMKF